MSTRKIGAIVGGTAGKNMKPAKGPMPSKTLPKMPIKRPKLPTRLPKKPTTPPTRKYA